jgi:RNA 3'-terminal phosphate cyclase (ATP)
MIEIDGSTLSGSGTILRYSMALATLKHEPLHMVRIRAKRGKPGLRPQHLQSVRACSSLSGGRVDGAEAGSQEIVYHPGNSLKPGDFRWDIGTAGSTTMLAFTLIPIALFMKGPCRFSLEGGLFQDFAPSAFHMQKVLIPSIEKMGGHVRLEIARPGYVPQGQGRLALEVMPLGRPLQALHMPEAGNVRRIQGISLASHLAKEQVSERMAEQSRRLLEERGLHAGIEVIYDTSAVQKGAALLLWAETEAGSLVGADQAGKPGRRSESIANYVVKSLLEDLRAEATTDRHLADQLIIFAALAEGTTEYRIPTVTDHVEANLWLVEKILGAKGRLDGNYLRVEGIGLHPFNV